MSVVSVEFALGLFTGLVPTTAASLMVLARWRRRMRRPVPPLDKGGPRSTNQGRF